jgi:hypothetical protein
MQYLYGVTDEEKVCLLFHLNLPLKERSYNLSFVSKMNYKIAILNPKLQNATCQGKPIHLNPPFPQLFGNKKLR